MEPYYQDEYGTLYCGDSKEVLSKLSPNSVDMVITSPPYWALRSYKTASWIGGNENCNHVKDPSKTKVFGNPEFNKNRPSREATELPGYYYDKVCEKCGATKEDGQLGHEETFKEYISKLVSYFEPLDSLLKQEGTLWVNLGDTYYSSNKGTGGPSKKQLSNKGSRYNPIKIKAKELSERSLCLIPERFAIVMQDSGWILRNQIIWHKPNQMPSSAKNRFTHDYELIYFFTKSNKDYYFEQQFEPYTKPLDRWGGDKLIADGESEWDGGTGQTTYRDRTIRPNSKGKNKRAMWSINTKGEKGLNHFAKYPIELIITPILAGCPEGGVVLDPFFGSGTTAIACERLNRKWIGVELSKEYCDIAITRILRERGNKT